jgi:hypothetical protein
LAVAALEPVGVALVKPFARAAVRAVWKKAAAVSPGLASRTALLIGH